MRNTKLLVAMLAGCMTLSGAALAQDAASQSAPTPASTAATPTQSAHESMNKRGSMSHDSMKSGDSMKSTHKKHKKSSTSEPAKSSTAGGM